MKMIRRSDGVIELPFRLIIISIVMLLTMATVGSLLVTYSDNQIMNNINSELQRFEGYVHICSQGGIHTSLTITLDFSSSFLTRLSWMEIGDTVIGDETSFERGKDVSKIIFKLNKGGTKSHVIVPLVIMTYLPDDININPNEVNGEKFIINSNTINLRLENRQFEKNTIICISRV